MVIGDFVIDVIFWNSRSNLNDDVNRFNLIKFIRIMECRERNLVENKREMNKVWFFNG